MFPRIFAIDNANRMEEGGWAGETPEVRTRVRMEEQGGIQKRDMEGSGGGAVGESILATEDFLTES